MRHIPDNNLAYPILIRMDSGSCGSGFFLRSGDILYLVTAKHVFLSQEDEFLCKKEFNIIAYSEDILIKEPAEISVQLESVKNEIKKHNSFDVVIIKIGDIKLNPETKSDGVAFLNGVRFVSKPDKFRMVWVGDEHFKKYEDIFISNDIFILGYPVSVGDKYNEQIDFNKPLLRKGIVAGKNENKRTIILDSSVYFGNSGGLVLEVDPNPNGVTAFRPIGIITEYIPFVDELFSSKYNKVVSINISNSGYSVAVPIDTILDLI